MVLPQKAVARPHHHGLVVVLLAAVFFVAVLSPVRDAAASGSVRILRLRHFSDPAHTRIVLDLDRASSFEVRRVQGPDRIAVNIPGAVFATVSDRSLGDGLVERIRCNVGAERAQIVIDLAGRCEFRAFSLPPSGEKPHRIVIDVLRAMGSPPPIVETVPVAATDRESVVVATGEIPLVGGDAAVGGVSAGVNGTAVSRGGSLDVSAAESPATVDQRGDEVTAPIAPAADDAPAGTLADLQEINEADGAAPPVDPVESEDPFVVVIDPGHGGDDPGAVRGPLLEKDLCLDIGREMARQLEQLPGYRVVMTRDRDRTVALNRRVDIARREKGDVFLSIHCNTHPRPAVSGMEVYFLSLQGATDREARELADKENAAGLVGLAPGEVHADLVVDILMDLKMTRVLQDSGRLAAALLTAADRSGVVAGRRVKQAGFQVLKTLAMPSALVEVAYLSNPEDHRLLGNATGRRRLAGAIVSGLEEWRAGTVPMKARPAPVIAMRAAGERWENVYKVRSGDSLWKLADRYGTTMNEIARRNNLSERERELRIGQRLHLPNAGLRP